MPKKTIIALHICFWVLRVGTEFPLFQLPYINKEPLWEFWTHTIITWATLVAYFYINYSWLVPKYLIKSKFTIYTVCSLITTTIVFEILSVNWNHFDLAFLIPQKEFVPLIAFACAIHYFASTAFRLLIYWQESEKMKKLLIQEVKETELLYLKSQMSPHFLFNTLNNIYGLSINKSTLTTSAIRQLKELMIYVKNFKDGARIPITEEVKYLKSFIALNALRYECDTDFQIQIDEDVLIEPMILLPFIENAYKHGDTRASSKIEVNLILLQGAITFTVKNKIDDSKRKDEVGGIGIRNIIRRLELIYGQKLSLSAMRKNEDYHVQLSIQLR